MTELWLNFKDENGEPRRVAVAGARFMIGRHSECDLTITDSRLSRHHAKIEGFGEVFVISDAGSSNGTEVNGNSLKEPVALKDGDVISLGGFEVSVELKIDRPAPKPRKDASKKTAADVVATETNGSSIPTAVFIAAPVIALALVICGAGALFFANGDRTTDVRQTPTPGFVNFDSPSETPAPTSSPKSTASSPVSPEPSGSTPSSTPELSDEKRKIEVNAAAFLRAIALNDPSAYLKSSEVDAIAARMAQLKGSPAFVENLRAVKNGASQFQSMAQSKGLKPQFLAAAALAELGTSRGAPADTAQRMLPVFSELRVSLANNLADDNLLMVAAYNQGKSGQFKALRNTLEALAKKHKDVSPREIRTIWFLKKQGKLTDAEFDFALRFIAAGTILQNPKEFSVNAEAVTF